MNTSREHELEKLKELIVLNEITEFKRTNWTAGMLDVQRKRLNYLLKQKSFLERSIARTSTIISKTT